MTNPHDKAVEAAAKEIMHVCPDAVVAEEIARAAIAAYERELWVPIQKASLEPATAYYIIADYGNGPIQDVVFYEGKDKAGEHIWILSDVEIDHRDITHVSALRPHPTVPEGE